MGAVQCSGNDITALGLGQSASVPVQHSKSINLRWRKRTRESGREKRRKERESDARLEWKKGLSPEIGVKKTMNAGGVDCEKCWMQVSPVPASHEVCPPVCASYEMCSRVSSTNLKGFVKGILETGGMMDKCGQGTMARWLDKEMWTRNYGALGQMARVCFGVLCANKKEEVKRDFGDLRIRRSEGRVVNTPLVFKKKTGGKEKGQRKRTRESGREKGRKEKGREKGQESPGERRDGKRVGERERERVMPALNGKKG
ncbi:hypothetical protein TNCV_4109541 [Trichonephila clavipes]|nr:hypothetical protein TNCV_4109541 [Trichonephila clavipes]